MSTKHSKAAEKFLQDSKMAAWHNETLWMVRAKRDKMSKEVPEWEELRNKACELKLYSNSHLEELLLEFEKNATANGAIVHWACLLYTSDAADDLLCVDLGGARIIKKKQRLE